MNQPELFTVTSPPPDTRALAREKVQPTKKNLHIRLLKDFYEREFNADQWAAEHGLNFMNARPRVAELAKCGLLRRAGHGLTVSGNPQRTYRLYEFYQRRLETLAAQIGIDAGAEALLAEVGLK